MGNIERDLGGYAGWRRAGIYDADIVATATIYATTRYESHYRYYYQAITALYACEHALSMISRVIKVLDQNIRFV